MAEIVNTEKKLWPVIAFSAAVLLAIGLFIWMRKTNKWYKL